MSLVWQEIAQERASSYKAASDLDIQGRLSRISPPMKYIQNVTVSLPAGVQKQASSAKIATVDTSGVYTTTAHFLCGENPWGFHQDYLFSSPFSNVRAGRRICEAAKKALDKDLPNVEISSEDYALLLNVLANPRPSAPTPMHPALAREVLKIVESIERGSSEPFEKDSKEEKTEVYAPKA